MYGLVAAGTFHVSSLIARKRGVIDRRSKF
jgi:hypothetical protein